MWIDQRGSEVLSRAECLRLLAIGAHSGALGRVAAPTDSAPLVHPVNFSFEDGHVLVLLGDGTMAQQLSGRLVAFEVDAVESPAAGHEAAGSAWSVLVRGLAVPVPDDIAGPAPARHRPRPLVPIAGQQLYSIRPDVVSGRRFLLRDADAASMARH